MMMKKMFRCLLVAVAALTVSLTSQAAMVGTEQIQSNPIAVELGEERLALATQFGASDTVDASGQDREHRRFRIGSGALRRH